MLIGVPSTPTAFLTVTGSGIVAVAGACQAQVASQTIPCLSQLGTEVYFAGCNVNVVSGAGATTAPVNGLGNLVIGYNEADQSPHDRAGSHNLVIGPEHTYTSFGGFVAGFSNRITGEHCSVLGGFENEATGGDTTVAGGQFNTARFLDASIGGGRSNVAEALDGWIGGGTCNYVGPGPVPACDPAFLLPGASSVSGGRQNAATGDFASVSGGEQNTASGNGSALGGGKTRTASGDHDWAAGSLLEDQ